MELLFDLAITIRNVLVLGALGFWLCFVPLASYLIEDDWKFPSYKKQFIAIVIIGFILELARINF